MDKRKITILTVSVTALAMIAIVFSLLLLKDKEQESTIPFDVIAEQLIMVNYKNDYESIINGLPEEVTSIAKTMLINQTAQAFTLRAPYGEIKDLEIVLYSQDVVQDGELFRVISKYKELLLFNAPMTSITTFTVQKGRVIDVETHDYTDSVLVSID